MTGGVVVGLARFSVKKIFGAFGAGGGILLPKWVLRPFLGPFWGKCGSPEPKMTQNGADMMEKLKKIFAFGEIFFGQTWEKIVYDRGGWSLDQPGRWTRGGYSTTLRDTV